MQTNGRARLSFSLLRGLFLSVFALFYLFSRRFGWRAKLLLVALGFLHVGVISIPIIAYQWPESTLLPQAGLVWTPVVAYFVILFVHWYRFAPSLPIALCVA